MDKFFAINVTVRRHQHLDTLHCQWDEKEEAHDVCIVWHA